MVARIVSSWLLVGLVFGWGFASYEQYMLTFEGNFMGVSTASQVGTPACDLTDEICHISQVIGEVSLDAVLDHLSAQLERTAIIRERQLAGNAAYQAWLAAERVAFPEAYTLDFAAWRRNEQNPLALTTYQEWRADEQESFRASIADFREAWLLMNDTEYLQLYRIRLPE